MRLLFGSCFTLLIAAALGLGATWFTMTRGVAFGALTIGAWTAWPKSGSVDIDPYARASIARSGELPTGMGDGIAFYAHTDDAGDNLDGRCTFTISGMTPPARYWTVALYDPAGRLVANTIDRHGFTSEEIVRDIDGTFAITAAPLARPGNWLPTGGVEQFVLVWRLYDTPIGVATTDDQRRPDAGDRAKGLLMIRGLLWILAAILLAGIVHLSTVLAMPQTATQDAYSRLAPLTPINAVVPLAPPTSKSAVMPFMDPAFAAAVCRYDLTGGSLKLIAPVSQAYTSVTFYTRKSVAYYAINDRAAGRHSIELDLMTPEQHAALPEDEDVTAADRLIIESPSTMGLIVLRALAPEPGLMPMARQALAGATCDIQPVQ